MYHCHGSWGHVIYIEITLQKCDNTLSAPAVKLGTLCPNTGHRIHIESELITILNKIYYFILSPHCK